MASLPDSPLDGLSLLRLGRLIYERDGAEACRRWYASLSPDQQLAVTAEVDQFSAYIRDLMTMVRPINDEDGWRPEHERHAALGENHWFSCPFCDDEAEDV